jgi:hypothetical protein
MQEEVFLSYSSDDKDFVRRIHSRLTECGYKVWIDRENILGGDSIVGDIEEAVSKVKAFIPVLSPAALSSTWVVQEYRTCKTLYLNGENIKIVPILFESCEVPPFLKDIRYIDFRDKSESAFRASFEELVKALGRVRKRRQAKKRQQQLDKKATTIQPYRCPICGQTQPSISYSFWSRLSKMSTSVSPPAEYAAPSVNVELELSSRFPPNPRYDCKGCKTKYWDISGVDIEHILQKIVMKNSEVESQFVERYGTITPSRLIRSCRTGIVRKSGRLGRDDERIIICIRHSKSRSFVICAKRKDNDHYEIQGVGVP